MKASTWFSLTYVEYNDVKFNKGTFRISLNSGIDENNNVINPFIKLSIDESIKHSFINVKYCDFAILTHNMQECFKQKGSYVFSIKGKNFEFSFIKHSTDSDNYFQIKIGDETSLSSVVIDIANMFYIIKQLCFIRDNWALLTTNFIQPCSHLMTSHNQEFIASRFSYIEDLMKRMIQSQENNTPLTMREVVNNYSGQDISQDCVNTDFDSFIGGSDVSNVSLPYNIQEKMPQVQESILTITHNRLFDDVLKGSLKNIEDIINCCIMSQDPVNTFLDNILMKSDLNKESFFVGCKSEDLKSLFYIQTSYYKYYIYGYLKSNQNEVIPGQCCISMFKPYKQVTSLHKDFLYSLLVIVVFYRLYSERMATKTKDIRENKILMYFSLRCLSDGILFSNIIDDTIQSKKDYLNSITNYIMSTNMLTEMNDMLYKYGFEKITVNDIVIDALDFFQYFATELRIDERHQDFFSRQVMKLPVNSDFTLEEMIQCGNIEALIRNDEKIEKYEDFDSRNLNATDKVRACFIKNEPIKKAHDNTLFKYCNDRKTEIPPSMTQEFLEYLKQVDSIIILEELNQKFNLSEFGTNILKALSLWSPAYTNYLDFVYLVEGSHATKEDIISKIMMHTEESKTPDQAQSSDWSDISW